MAHITRGVPALMVAAFLMMTMFLGNAPAGASAAAAPASCESLAALSLPNTTITSARIIAAGAYAPPGTAPSLPPVHAPGPTSTLAARLGLGYEGGRGRPPQFSELPAFCRVTATVKPTPVSAIRIEVWMPTSGWNGKFRGTGMNGPVEVATFLTTRWRRRSVTVTRPRAAMAGTRGTAWSGRQYLNASKTSDTGPLMK